MSGNVRSKERQYWDASIVTATIGGEPAASICSRILLAAERGEVEIVTSALTIAEVTGGRRSAYNQDVHDQIDRYQKRIYRLAANDAIHLATALASNVDIMFSLDADDHLPPPEEYATSDGRPLSITHPRWTYQTDFLESADEPSNAGPGDTEPTDPA